MPGFAPEILRQRLLVEGYYTRDVDDHAVEEFLLGVAAHLDLRSYGKPVIFAPAGLGREEHEGYDAFLPLIDSGISVYVWTGPRFVSTVLFTCKAFADDLAVAYTKDCFGLTDFEHRAF